MPCPFFHTFNFPKLQVLRALASLRSLSVLPDNLRRHASLSLSCQMPLLFPPPTHTIRRVKCASMQRNRWVALPPACVSILQQTSAYVSIRQHTSAFLRRSTACCTTSSTHAGMHLADAYASILTYAGVCSRMLTHAGVC